MSGFAEKLIVQNSINSMENSVHYKYGIFGFEEKVIAIVAKIQWEIEYIIRTECLNLLKIDCPNCRKSTGNCVHYICTECLDLQRKLNIQNSKNSRGNCIHYICKEWLNLQKN